MLASLIAGFASGETVLALQRAKRAFIAYLCAAIAGACGAGFLIAALYMWFADRYGALETAIGFGVVFIVITILILTIHALAERSRSRRFGSKRNSDLKAIGVATAVAALPALLRAKPGVRVLLAPAVAFAAYALYRRSRTPGPDTPPE